MFNLLYLVYFLRLIPVKLPEFPPGPYQQQR